MLRLTLRVVLLCIVIGFSFSVYYQLFQLVSRKVQEHSATPRLLPTINLSTMLKNFPWESLEQETANISLDSKNRTVLLQNLILDLTNFAVIPPLIDINKLCPFWPHPERLSLVTIKKLHPSCVFRSPKSRPVRIGVLITLGFDADSLEIHMRESGDLVDYFFLTESTRTHAHMVTKPLVWEKLKEQERFSPFLQKVVHFVADDANLAMRPPDVNNSSPITILWRAEKTQEKFLWVKFLEWNNSTLFFETDDLISFGHADEVASRKVIEVLKNCKVTKDPIDVGIWFPFGNINQSFLTDFPVRGHPYTLGSPTFWRFQTAKAEWEHGRLPCQQRGLSQSPPLLGGMHLSAYSYLPFAMLHSITATEGGLSSSHRLNWFRNRYVPGAKSIQEIQAQVKVLPQHIANRVISSVPASYRDVLLGKLNANHSRILPWFLECNLQRYVEWVGKPDSRVH